MPSYDAAIIGKLLDVLSIILTGGLVFILRRLFQQDRVLTDHETAIALCTQRDQQREVHRKEDRDMRDRQRKEIMQRIDRHHKLVMDKLDRLISS